MAKLFPPTWSPPSVGPMPLWSNPLKSDVPVKNLSDNFTFLLSKAKTFPNLIFAEPTKL